jgi:hypothetical protein
LGKECLQTNITVIACMKPQIFALVSLLFVTSCNTRQDAGLSDHKSKDARTHEKAGRKEAIAKEIISIQYAFGDAVLHLRDTGATIFVAKVEALADRLERIAAELDRLGSFPASLREATLKRLDDDEKALPQLVKNRTRSGPLPPEIAKITNPAVDRYFSASGSVMLKAGLLIEAKGDSPATPPTVKTPSLQSNP